MKRVLCFIGLKVAEISAVVFIPYFLGMLFLKWEWYVGFMELEGAPLWLVGFLSILIGIIAPVTIVVLLVIFIMGNWNLAGKLSE